MSKTRMRLAVSFAWLCIACGLIAQPSADPGAGPSPRGQAAADEIRSVAGADAAFLAAGLLKFPDPGGDLAGILQYPSEEISVVLLTGKEIREALERSVSNYPDSSSAFLQLSGLSVVFLPASQVGSRIVEVRINEAPLIADKSYEVAMPTSLARGALGYFKVWDKSQIVRTLNTTVEQALKGKTGSVRTPRYTVR